MKTLIKKLTPQFLLNFYYQLWPAFSAFLYGFPSRKLIVIGVTGTNGKSTVVEMCHRIFTEAGHKVASLSSIRFKIGDKEWKNTLKMTMPGRFKLQKFLKQAVDAGCQYAVLEVTSEGIKQYRHKFIDFDTAVFTNLTPEHIEAHGSFENYRLAKGKLFRVTKNIHVINLDDKNAKYFLEFPANKKYTYGLNQGDINNKDIQLNLKLLGEFNIHNALAAICVGLSQGIDLNVCKKALEKIDSIPGRLETVIREPFMVIVDYAHTPDSLKKVYETVKIFNFQFPIFNQAQNSNDQNPKLICVLGAAGGGRDKWKRPELGKIAAKYCDQIILTNEDPYDENPLSILEQIESGFSQIQNPKSKIQNYKKILDRREAIRETLKIAKPGDTIIITGKGCEPWMMIESGKKIPWDDREVIREFITNSQSIEEPRI